jgi:hypothetical protein
MRDIFVQNDKKGRKRSIETKQPKFQQRGKIMHKRVERPSVYREREREREKNLGCIKTFPRMHKHVKNKER